MGYNTPVLLLNDSMHELERDPELGKKLSAAAARAHMLNQHVDVSSGGHCNAATVYPSAHADVVQVMAFGGNHATNLISVFNGGNHYTEEAQVTLLRELANKYGFTLVRKRKSGTRVG